MNKAICCILALFCCLFSLAQDDLHDHRLNENKWTDIRDGIRYQDGEGAGREWTYENKREYDAAEKNYREGGNGKRSYGSGDGANRRERESSSRQNTDYDRPDMSMPPINLNLSWLGWVLVILLVAALIYLIVYFFLNAQQDGKKIFATDEIEELNPIEIPLTELERLLQEALARQDYRGAVRVYFIFILRDLTVKNLIEWEKDKTNFQYLREMTANKNYNDFNLAVGYFEIVWYGKREIDSTAFSKIQPKFTQFLDKLGVK